MTPETLQRTILILSTVGTACLIAALLLQLAGLMR